MSHEEAPLPAADQHRDEMMQDFQTAFDTNSRTRSFDHINGSSVKEHHTSVYDGNFDVTAHDQMDSIELRSDLRTDGYERHDAKVDKTTHDGGSVTYHAYDIKDPKSYIAEDRDPHGALLIRRRDSEGKLVSEKRITKPETIQKFGSLIAKQAVRRSEKRTASEQEAA